MGFIAFWGRIFLSMIFLFSGVHKVLEWPETEQAITQHLTAWIGYLFGLPPIQVLFQDLLAMTDLILIGAVICQLLGGLCVLLGVQVRFGAFLLIIFLVPYIVIVHPFWFLHGLDHELQVMEFLKNLAILGGLFILLAYGKGRSSPPKVVAAPSPPAQ